MNSANSKEALPSLPLEEWQETYTTLHMWTQIVGKIRLALSPMLNHWWQVPLYLTSRGLTTSPMYSGQQALQIDFDFLNDKLLVQSSAGGVQVLPLVSRPVADFYRDVMEALHALGAEVEIWPVPVEVEERIPFDQDRTHSAYDPEQARRFWRVLLQVDRVMKIFRGRFTGKSSPVHFFWGSFDMAVTRFSGRKAPLMDRAANVAKYVMREAYSDEVSSCGFWPGKGLGEAAFYAYAYPEPGGYPQAAVQPAQAIYQKEMGEYLLPYESVRTSPDWEEAVLSFFQSTYEAAADLAGWDRQTLESSYLISPSSSSP